MNERSTGFLKLETQHFVRPARIAKLHWRRQRSKNDRRGTTKTACMESLLVKMFVFSDLSLRKAVIAAKHRGVKVRVMLNPARRSGEQDNETTRHALERADIEVKDANPAFALTHEVLAKLAGDLAG